MGYKSIAVSTESDSDFEFPARFIADNLDTIVSMIDNPSTIININIPFPEKARIKGAKVTPLGIKRYNDRYELLKDTGESGYYLIGNPITVPENPTDCDVELTNEGYISISPLTIQLTDYTRLNTVKDKKFKL
jgi:5'-nucleotidase